jgi:glycosyltransferase involved in cell wall biosynthesis
MSDLQPTFTVIAPTFNRREIVLQTLRHLAAQDYPHSRFEVLLVDNSSDDTPEMVEEFATTAPMAVRLLRSGERLPAVKRNEGLVAATGEYVVFINDDVWFAPDFLREHARSHERATRPVAVLGHVYQSPAMPQTPFIARYRPFAYHEIAERADRTVTYRYSWSMNLSLPRAEMLENGLTFHEDWRHIGHEDVELGWRWTRSGREIVYNPRATGEHFHPHTVVSARRLQESVGRGLRDLEALIPDPGLLERYGVFSWRNSPRSIARGLVRRALFNATTSARLAEWLDRRTTPSRFQDWCYWKVLLEATNRGYRDESGRGFERAVRPALEPKPDVAGGILGEVLS